MSHTLPLYRFDSDSGEYLELDKPPRAKKVKLKEVEYPYRDGNNRPLGETYTVIMDETEDAKEILSCGGKVLREFEAWVVT
jgi:hypothetical protein